MVMGMDMIIGIMLFVLIVYVVGQLFYFIVNVVNIGVVMINIDGFGVKSIICDGSIVFVGGDINLGEVVVVVYDGICFQMINVVNLFGNTMINGTLMVMGNIVL